MFSLTPTPNNPTYQTKKQANNKADNQKPTVTKLMHWKYSPTTTLSTYTYTWAHTHACTYTCTLIHMLKHTIGESCHKYNFCCYESFVGDKHVFVVTSACLSWQNMSFVVTKICLLWQNFCCDKIMFMFVATNICCHVNKTSFLLRQKNACHDKTFVMTKLCLSWQAYFCCIKRCVFMWQTCLSESNFCRNKNHTCGSSCQWQTHISRMSWRGELWKMI